MLLPPHWCTLHGTSKEVKHSPYSPHMSSALLPSISKSLSLNIIISYQILHFQNTYSVIQKTRHIRVFFVINNPCIYLFHHFQPQLLFFGVAYIIIRGGYQLFCLIDVHLRKRIVFVIQALINTQCFFCRVYWIMPFLSVVLFAPFQLRSTDINKSLADNSFVFFMRHILIDKSTRIQRFLIV